MRYLKILLFLFIGFSSQGQKNAALEDSSVNLSTPYHTILNHLEWLQKGHYNPAMAAKSLDAGHLPIEKQKRLAVQLKQVLDGKGLYIDPDVLPQEENYIDSSTKLNRYVLSIKARRIFVEKVNGQWLYPKSVLEVIPVLHKEVYPFGASVLVNAVPESWHFDFLGLEVWQYFGLIFLVLLALVLHKAVSFLLNQIIVRVLNRLQKKSRFTVDTIIKEVARPLSWAIITLFIAQFVPALQLPILLNKYLVILLELLVPLFFTLVFFKLVTLLSGVFAKLADKTESTLDDQLIPLLRKGLKGLVILIGVIYMLRSLEVDVTAYLLGLSFGGLALAFAAQDTVKNILGSFMIFADRPFQIGDWINYDGVDGTVEEVGFRSTRVRTFYNSVVSIPNGKLADSKVDNYGVRVYRRFSTKISVTYDTPPDVIEEFVKGLRQLVERHPTTRKDYFEVHLNEMGAHSLDILFYIFFQVPTWSDEVKGRHEIITGILELAKTMGVRFAFPTQTIHIEEFPGQASGTPMSNAPDNEMSTKITAYLEKYSERFSKNG